MIVRRALKNSTVVPGGGAIDMEISRYLRQHSRTISGKSQLFINSYAKTLEVIPRQLCDNAGFDVTDVLNKLGQKHALPSGANFGVDINTGAIADSFNNFVWEPAVVKINAINAATEAACLILSVDETVKNPKSESAQGDASGMGGRGRGGGAMGGRGYIDHTIRMKLHFHGFLSVLVRRDLISVASRRMKQFSNLVLIKR